MKVNSYLKTLSDKFNENQDLLKKKVNERKDTNKKDNQLKLKIKDFESKACY